MIISADEKIASILPKIKEGIRTFIVKEGDEYVGIVTDRVTYTSQFDPNAKVKNYVVKAPLITKETKLEKIAEFFLHGYRELPYFDEKFELLKFTNLLKNLLSEKRILPKKISEIKLLDIVKVDKDESIAEAMALMRKKKIHHLGIYENGKLIGIVSSADIMPYLMKVKERTPLVRERMGPSTIKISSIPYLPKIYEISPDSTLVDAADKMIKNEVMTLICDGKFLHFYHILKEAIAKERLTVEISGYDVVGEQIEDVKKEIEQLIERVNKSIPVDYAKLTIKAIRETGERKRYTLKFLMTFGKEKIAVDSSDWEIHKAVHYLKEEVEKIVKHKKERMKGKKIGKRWRLLSAKLREGEYFYFK